MNEGGWTLSPASEMLNPDIQAHTEVTELRYIDHQLAGTLRTNLETSCQGFFTELKNLYESKDGDDWMPKFLISFLLLHHWEILMKQQEAIARERKVEVSGAVRLAWSVSHANNDSNDFQTWTFQIQCVRALTIFSITTISIRTVKDSRLIGKMVECTRSKDSPRVTDSSLNTLPTSLSTKVSSGYDSCNSH